MGVWAYFVCLSDDANQEIGEPGLGGHVEGAGYGGGAGLDG